MPTADPMTTNSTSYWPSTAKYQPLLFFTDPIHSFITSLRIVEPAGTNFFLDLNFLQVRLRPMPTKDLWRLFIRVFQENTFSKKIKSEAHHVSAWWLVWTDPKRFLTSTKFKAAPSHLKFEILPSFWRRRRRNVPILNVLLFNLMLCFRATSLKRTCHWPRRV